MILHETKKRQKEKQARENARVHVCKVNGTIKKNDA